MQPIYLKNYIDPFSIIFEIENLEWEERVSARKEYFMGENKIYIYSNRSYYGKPFTKNILNLMNQINNEFDFKHDVCFLNRYDTQHQALGWHADDADTVSIISIGSERQIWWKEKNFKGKIPDSNKKLLENGSLFIMPNGFQEKYYHKIPKHDTFCNTRISLTFRKLK